MLASRCGIAFQIADGRGDAVRPGPIGGWLDQTREILEQGRDILQERAGDGMRHVVVGRQHDGAQVLEHIPGGPPVQCGDGVEILERGVRPGDLDDDRVHQPVRFDHAPQRGDDAVVRNPRDARTVSACLHILEEPVHVLDLLAGCLCHFTGLSSTLSLIRMPFHPDPSGGP